MDRDEFMKFFRDDEKLATLSTDDRLEVFHSILVGSSDITVDLLDDLLDDYAVGGIRVIKTKRIDEIRAEFDKAIHERFKGIGNYPYKQVTDWALNDFVALHINKIINPE